MYDWEEPKLPEKPTKQKVRKTILKEFWLVNIPPVMIRQVVEDEDEWEDEVPCIAISKMKEALEKYPTATHVSLRFDYCRGLDLVEIKKIPNPTYDEEMAENKERYEREMREYEERLAKIEAEKESRKSERRILYETLKKEFEQ